MSTKHKPRTAAPEQPLMEGIAIKLDASDPRWQVGRTPIDDAWELLCRNSIRGQISDEGKAFARDIFFLGADAVYAVLTLGVKRSDAPPSQELMEEVAAEAHAVGKELRRFFLTKEAGLDAAG